MTKRALFLLRQIIATPKVMSLIQQYECSHDLYHLLLRHQTGEMSVRKIKNLMSRDW